MRDAAYAIRILAEAGTHELERLLFDCGGVTFGINVARVKEIVRRVENIPIPCALPGIGVSFKIGDGVLTLVNQATGLDMDPAAFASRAGL